MKHSAASSTPPSRVPLSRAGLRELSDDLSLEQILAAESAPPRRFRAGDSARGLGIFDADGDLLDQYLFEVSRTPLLTLAQEVAIARRSARGDDDARRELVRRNLRFVISVAKKYQNRGLALTDLIGEGNVGLMTAARKFDPDQGVKFISYAVWWIRQAILASLARTGRRVIRSAEALRQELGREPVPAEIAAATGISLDVVRSLVALNTAEVRLDAPLDFDGDRTLIDRFGSDDTVDPESEIMARFRAEEVARAMRTLPPRDARVLTLYFGLDGGTEHTLEEIGSMLGITRERVRQLRDRALLRLRNGERGEALKSFAA
jgi:RNA polymerase primary sigma factor